MSTKRDSRSRMAFMMVITLLVLLVTLVLPTQAKAEGDAQNPGGSPDQLEIEVTRGQWIHELVETFDMKVEQENWPEEYFSDIEPDSPYYHDYLLALEFGAIDTPVGGELRPDDAATREFVAHTLNYCLGYEYKEEDYTFGDYELCSYPDDDQIAVFHHWFSLIDGSFIPDRAVTSAERDSALKDARSVLESTVVDENHIDEVVVSEEVKVIPDGTEVIQVGDNEYQVIDCPIDIQSGDTFVAYFYGIPRSFVALSVTIVDGVTTIITEEADSSEVYEYVDCEGSFEPDINDITVSVEPSEGTALRGTKKAEPFEVKTDVVKKEITVKGKLTGKYEDYNLTGTVDFQVKVWNLSVDWKDDADNKYAILKGNIDVGVAASGGFKKSDIPLIKITIAGVGEIPLTADIAFTGDAYVACQNRFECGVQWTSDSGMRTVQSFTKESFTARAKAELSADFKISAGINLVVFKADVYCKVGPHVECTYQHYSEGTPADCLTLAMYLKGSVGAEAAIVGIAKLDLFADFWTKSNSPVHIYSHYEDGKLVSKCTRNGGGYLTDSDGNVAQVYGGGLPVNLEDTVNTPPLGASSGAYSTDVWEFSLTSDTTATITLYKGTSTSIIIPSSICGYTVTAVGNNTFKNSQVTSVVYPTTVRAISTSYLGQMKKITILGDGVFQGSLSLEGCTLTAHGTLDTYNLTLSNCSVKVDDKLKSSHVSLANSTVECDAFSGWFYTSGSSRVDVAGDADITLSGMDDGDVIHVGGNLDICSIKNSYPYNETATIAAGTVEAEGNVTIQWHDYRGNGSHVLNLCGVGEQKLSLEPYSGDKNQVCRAPVIIRNPNAKIDARTGHANLILAGNSNCKSISCESIDLNGKSLKLSGDLSAGDVTSPSGSSLSCATIGHADSWPMTFDAQGSSISVSGNFATHYLYLRSSTLHCESLDIPLDSYQYYLSMSGASRVDVTRNATIGLESIDESSILHVGGNLIFETYSGGNGTIEGEGNVTIVSDGLSYGWPYLLRLCGSGGQMLSINGDSSTSLDDPAVSSRISLLNSKARISVPNTTLTIVEDGTCASMLCAALDTNGKSLSVGGDVNVNYLNATDSNICISGNAVVHDTLELARSTLTSMTLSAGRMSMSGDSDVDVSGKVTVNFSKMSTNDSMHVGGDFVASTCGNYINDGTIEVEGNVTFGDEGYYGSDSHAIVLCGTSNQTMTDGESSVLISPFISHNANAVIDCSHSCITLSEDSCCKSLKCSNLDMKEFSLDVGGDASLSLSSMGFDSILHVGGTFRGRTIELLNKGTVEVEGNFYTTGSYTSSDTHVVVFCGKFSQMVSYVLPSMKIHNVINTHEDESAVRGLTYTGTYVHDPEYYAGCRYIQFATVSEGEYTDESASPEVYYGSNALSKGVDYDIVLTPALDNTYNLNIVGLAPYKGVKAIASGIVLDSINDAIFTGYEDAVYSGRQHTPEITVTINNRTLEKNKDYTVSYGDNRDVGIAYIYVRGMGNYAGSKTLSFTIYPTEAGQYVIDLIAALGDNTLADEPAIADARAEYDALAQVDRESVTNYSRLTSAESAMASLHAAVEGAEQAIGDAEALLLNVAVSTDGTDVAEGEPWLAQAQADDLSSKVANARTYVEAGGTLSNLRNATSSLSSAYSTAKDAIGVQLGTMHKPGDPIEEDRVEPTCTDEGSYDLVTYCGVCGEEVSRVHKTVDALGHDYDSLVVAPTWDDAGYTRHTCSRCQDTYDDGQVESLKMQGVLSVEAAIAGLPAPENLTLADAEAVAAARASLDTLTEEQQELASNVNTLALAEARLSDLLAAKAVDDLLAALPASDEVALTDQAEVAAARAAYDALTDAQKALVANLEALVNAEQAIDDLVSQLQLVGTCVWEVTADGELVISPIPGRTTGELPDTWDSPAGSGSGSLWTGLMGESRPAYVTSVRFEPGVRAGASLSLFLGNASGGEEYFPNLRSVDLSNLDTTDVADVSALFAGNESLESVAGVESLVSATVTDARDVFCGCLALGAVDISSWDTSGIADAYAIDGLFEGCDSLAEVRLGEGLEMARLDIDLPDATWTNGSLYVGGATIKQLSADQAASTWVRHTPIDISTACEFAAIPAQQHTGSPVTPLPVVTYEGIALECETNGQATGAGFAVTYEDNVSVGEATAIVTGQGRFSGEVRVPFRILAQGDFDVEHMVEELESAVATARADSARADATLDAARTAASGDDIEAAEARAMRAESAESQAAQAEWDAQSAYEAAVTYASTCPEGERAEAESAVEEALATLRTATQSHSDAQDELTAARSALDDIQQRQNAVTEAKAAAEGAAQALADAQAALEEATDLANATVSEVPTYGYTGTATEPRPTVTVNGATLRLGTDYALGYVGNTDAGTATVVVEGAGHFGGSQSVEFAILPKDLSEVAVATVPDAIYTGGAIRPELTLTDGGRTLVKGTDYEVSFEANIDAGDALAHANGKGNYKGTADVAFRILKAAISPEVTLASWSWADAPSEPTVTGNPEGTAVAYEYKPYGADDGDYAPTAPTEPGRYTVRATVAEGANHLGGTCACDFAITWLGVTFDANGGEGSMTPQSFEREATQALADNVFAREGMRFTGWNTKADGTGQAYGDGATVTLSESVTLYAQWADAHHTVTFMSNGVVEARLTTDSVASSDFPSAPTPLYGFEFTGWDKTAAEVNAELAGGDVTVTARFKAKQNAIVVTIYNGESEEPETMTLSESQWVKVTAEDVQGKNFAYWTMGGTVLSYNRVAQFRTATSCTVTAVYTTDLSGTTVTPAKAKVTYTGKEQKPGVAKVVLDGKTLVAGTDYVVSGYANNKNAGTAIVKITGKGAYTGEASGKFTIVKAAQPMKVKAKKATVSLAKVTKAAQKLGVSKVLTFTTKAQGTKTYKKLTGVKALRVNAKTGQVTVAKGTKKGTYKARVRVAAKGNKNYKSGSKVVTIKVVVK